jgi:Tyrosine phosphatase family
VDIDTRQFAHALEDLPDEVRDQAAEIAGTQPGLSLRRRVVDDCETAALDAFGTLEQAPLLLFLSRYPVTPYTYSVSPVVSRGQRPDAAKLADLSARGHRATINLCAEVDAGDAPAIVAAGLGGVLRTSHVPITDMEPPSMEQLAEVLDLLSAPDAELTYVHCEAGKGRTGAVIACYRMAVMGWRSIDALSEAVNFGCTPPGQLAFIREFGDMLLAGPVGRYPLLPAGSVSATPEQLAATVRTVSDAESGDVR